MRIQTFRRTTLPAFVISLALLPATLLWKSCESESSPPMKIAYNVLYDAEADNYEIFSMDLDGGNKKNISNWKGVDWVYYAWNDKIYFVSDRDTTHRMYFLYEMDANGDNVRKVCDFRLRDSWLGSRNDGAEYIVNPHKSVDTTAFYIIHRDHDRIKKVKPRLKYFSDPQFSPDGQKIVFRGATKKSKRQEGFIDEIYIMDADGGNRIKLSQYPAADTTAEWYAYRAGPPQWHPTDNFISYHSKQKGKYSLFAVSPDAQKQWKLTDDSRQEGWHSWSPDGRWLAVELFNDQQTQFHIGLLNWKDKTMTVLTDTSYKYQQAPVFVYE